MTALCAGTGTGHLLPESLAGEFGNSLVKDRADGQCLFVEIEFAGVCRKTFLARNLTPEPDIGARNIFHVVAEILGPHVGRLERQHISFPHRCDCCAARQASHLGHIDQRRRAFIHGDLDLGAVQLGDRFGNAVDGGEELLPDSRVLGPNRPLQPGLSCDDVRRSPRVELPDRHDRRTGRIDFA
jgi:hypothetical protein